MTGGFIFWIIAFLFSLILFTRARQMGYSGWVWGLMGFFVSWIGMIYLLAALPNRKLEQKRAKEMRLLKTQIQEARLRGREINSTIGSNITIGDQGTISDDKTID